MEPSVEDLLGSLNEVTAAFDWDPFVSVNGESERDAPGDRELGGVRTAQLGQDWTPEFVQERECDRGRPELESLRALAPALNR